jgi:hypothetical protein
LLRILLPLGLSITEVQFKDGYDGKVCVLEASRFHRKGVAMETKVKVAAEMHKDSGELTFQVMTPDLEERAQAFKAKYLGSRGGAAFSIWKFRQGPVDCQDCIILVLTQDGTIVGHVAAVVFPSVPGCPVPLLALGTEFIVHEKYRGGTHNVIGKMDALLGERLAQKGVELMFGTPNKPGYLVAKRLFRRADGPKCVYLSKVFTSALWIPQGTWRKAMHRLLIVGRFQLPGLPEGWRWEPLDSFVETEIDDFCHKFMRNIEIGTCRNATFLNWRYGGGDGFTYEKIRLLQGDRLMGLAVLRINPRFCEAAYLMEFMAVDPLGYDLLIRICINRASRRAPILSVLGVSDSAGFSVYLRHGFRSNSEILLEIGQSLARMPSKIRAFLVGKAENHFHLDDYLTVYNYADPSQSKEFSKARWYVTLGEKMGF